MNRVDDYNGEQPRKRVRLEPTEQSQASEAGDHEGTDGTYAPAPSADGVSSFDKSREGNVGISAFVSPQSPSFSGFLKKRYTDFLVNEILLDGQVLHLTSLTVPKRPATSGLKSGTGHGSTSSVKPKLPSVPSSAKSSTTDNQDSHHPQSSRQDLASQRPTSPENGNGATPSRASDKGEDQKASRKGPEKSSRESNEDNRKTLSLVFGEEVALSIIALHEQVLAHPEWKPKDFPIITSDVLDREVRTGAHQAVREIFSSQLETQTNQNGAINITAAPRSNGGGGRSARERGSKGKGWEQQGGEYLHFTLAKENKDTMEVLFYLASQLKIPVKNFQFAGTKDRRAVTVQRCCAYRTQAERLAKVGPSLRNAKIGDYEYKKAGLELGDLIGNEFAITLRDCSFPGEDGLTQEQRHKNAEGVLAEATKSFNEKGFINYYGLQRFGTFAKGTHSVGVKMLQGNLCGAIDDILDFSAEALAAAQDPEDCSMISTDDKSRAEALHTWKTTRSSANALQILPRKFSAERAIIQYMGYVKPNTTERSKENDYQGALNSIPRNLRLMYVHAYQSFIWNTVAGKRWELHGDNVVEGDLVITSEHKNTADIDPIEGEVDEQGEVVVHPATEDSAADSKDMFTRARPVSADEAASGKHSIFDIVLPLPGFDVEYPKNQVGAYYETLMASEQGGGLDPHNMRRKWKDISLSGSYRKFVARPLGSGLQYELKWYSRDEEQLVETDLDRLQRGKKRGETGIDANTTPLGGRHGETTAAATEARSDQKRAVVLKMQLGSSQYATMALRELLGDGGLREYRPEYGAGR